MCDDGHGQDLVSSGCGQGRGERRERGSYGDSGFRGRVLFSGLSLARLNFSDLTPSSQDHLELSRGHRLTVVEFSYRPAKHPDSQFRAHIVFLF